MGRKRPAKTFVRPVRKWCARNAIEYFDRDIKNSRIALAAAIDRNDIVQNFFLVARFKQSEKYGHTLRSKTYAAASTSASSITSRPKSAIASGWPNPRAISRRQFSKLVRKKQVLEVIAPIRPL